MDHPYETGEKVCYRLPDDKNLQRIGIIKAVYINPVQRVPKTLLKGQGKKQMDQATEQAPVFCIEDSFNGAYALVHLSLVVHRINNRPR